MPRVTFVKKARRDIGDIKAGESYYWWKFRFGGKRTSRTRPKQSQLTQSEFWGAIYALQEDNESAPDFDDIEGQIDTIKEELENIKSEIDDKISNMEQAFPNGCPVLETLQERTDALDSAISDLEGIDVSFEMDEDSENDEDTQKSARAEEIWSEVTDALSSIGCS